MQTKAKIWFRYSVEIEKLIQQLIHIFMETSAYNAKSKIKSSNRTTIFISGVFRGRGGKVAVHPLRHLRRTAFFLF